MANLDLLKKDLPFTPVLLLCSLLLVSCGAGTDAVNQAASAPTPAAAQPLLYKESTVSTGFSGSVGNEGTVSLNWLPDERAHYYEVHRELLSDGVVIADEKIAETDSALLTDYIELDGSTYRYRVIAISGDNEHEIIARYLSFDTSEITDAEEIPTSLASSSVDEEATVEASSSNTEPVTAPAAATAASESVEPEPAQPQAVLPSTDQEPEKYQSRPHNFGPLLPEFVEPYIQAAHEAEAAELDRTVVEVEPNAEEEASEEEEEIETATEASVPDGVDTPDAEPEIVIQSGPIPSFPGAEGHGASSLGGRGGDVIKVSNLNDSGAGSLRDALMMTEPRIIVFDVSGTIELQSRIELGPDQSYFTLAGQTAPGDGITLKNHSILLSGVEHGIIRYIRIRNGCPEGCNVSMADNISIASNTNHVMIDHVSMTWAEDEVMEIWGSHINNITVQWSLMGEGTIKCVEGNSQNLGPLLSGGYPQERITFANNYLAHTCYRNYLQDTGEYQFTNNLNYNTFKNDFHFSQTQYTGPFPVKSDVVGQYMKEGPQSVRRFVFDVLRYGNEADNGPWGTMSLYFSDIVAVTTTDDPHPYYLNDDPYSMVKRRSINTDELPMWEARSQPMTAADFPVTVVDAVDVPGKILPTVGASYPVRDIVDERIVDDFYTQGIWSAANVRQYPMLYTYNVKVDTDNDGMPDAWESAQGLDISDPSDNNVDSDGDGYTNIENYINSLVPGVWSPSE